MLLLHAAHAVACNLRRQSIQETFSEHSANFQCTFSEHSVNIQEPGLGAVVGARLQCDICVTPWDLQEPGPGAVVGARLRCGRERGDGGVKYR
jgi:hypothetical protein